MTIKLRFLRDGDESGVTNSRLGNFVAAEKRRVNLGHILKRVEGLDSVYHTVDSKISHSEILTIEAAFSIHSTRALT